MQPLGYGQTNATDVWGETQVGWGNFIVNAAPTTAHALLWRGSGLSVVDLNPAGFGTSTAFAVYGNTQVGHGFGTATSGRDHALIWHGTAESVVDIHPSGFIHSQALGIGENGNVVGYGVDSEGVYHAPPLASRAGTFFHRVSRAWSTGNNAQTRLLGSKFVPNLFLLSQSGVNPTIGNRWFL